MYKPIITKDADEEKDPSSRQSRRKVPYKGRAWLHLKDRWACTIGVQSLRHWTRQFLPSFLLLLVLPHFNAVRLGPDDFQRVGKEIKMHSLFLRGCVTDRTTAARISNSFDFLRLLVVYDRQSNGTLPAISDILAMRSCWCCYYHFKIIKK